MEPLIGDAEGATYSASGTADDGSVEWTSGFGGHANPWTAVFADSVDRVADAPVFEWPWNTVERFVMSLRRSEGKPVLCVGQDFRLICVPGQLSTVQQLALSVLMGEPCGQAFVGCMADLGIISLEDELVKKGRDEAFRESVRLARKYSDRQDDHTVAGMVARGAIDRLSYEIAMKMLGQAQAESGTG